MPVIRSLDDEESEIFLHLIQNKRQTSNDQERLSQELIDSACSTTQKEKLAKISEEENFAVKNRFLHDKNTM
jgi:hypothetical protein